MKCEPWIAAWMPSVELSSVCGLLLLAVIHSQLIWNKGDAMETFNAEHKQIVLNFYTSPGPYA